MNSDSFSGDRRTDGADHTAMLAVYLNDHLAGAAAGTALAKRLARNHRDTDMRGELDEIARQIVQDRGSLRDIMKRLGVRTVWYKAPLALLVERISRIKLNGKVLRRSALSTLVELETMELGVHGKASGWRSLRTLTDHVPELDPDQLDELLTRAERQSGRLEALRARAAAQALGGAHAPVEDRAR